MHSHVYATFVTDLFTNISLITVSTASPLKPLSKKSMGAAHSRWANWHALSQSLCHSVVYASNSLNILGCTGKIL